MAPLEANLVVHVHELDEPQAAWCDEHLLPCAVTQHFALEVSIDGHSEATPLEVVRAEGHE